MLEPKIGTGSKQNWAKSNTRSLSFDVAALRLHQPSKKSLVVAYFLPEHLHIGGNLTHGLMQQNAKEGRPKTGLKARRSHLLQSCIQQSERARESGAKHDV